MFYEWVSKGAEIGVEAFFAVFTFGLIVMVLWVLLSIGGKIMEAMDEDKRRE